MVVGKSLQCALFLALLRTCGAARPSVYLGDSLELGDSLDPEVTANNAEVSNDAVRLHSGTANNAEVSNSFLELLNASIDEGETSYLALAQRIQSQFQSQSQLQLQSQSQSNSSTSKFNCPWPCIQCCMAENSVYLNVGVTSLNKRDSTSFKCVFSETHEVTVTESLHKQRTCGAITDRNSDSTSRYRKTYCKLTPAEQKEVGSKLPECASKLVSGYDYWVSGECSIAIGTAIERMYFHTEHSVVDAVCMSKGKNFAKNGEFAGCRNKCTSQGSTCNKCMKAQICNVVQPDLATGRLDKFAMAVWAAGVGDVLEVNEIPKPVSAPRALQKVRIPGWAAKQAAFEAPAEDFQISLAMGGFQCMMSKLQSVPLTDDLTADKNNWGGSGPASPEQTNYNYFSGYGLYQQPLHFPVPADQMLTDKTLSRLVFEAIGAHRIEYLQDRQPLHGLNPMVPMLPMADQAPEGAVFALRMEGLFEDLPLRSGMARWGGNAFFANDGTLMAIQYNGNTATYTEATQDQAVLRMREYFKFVFRSSLVSTITAFDHLVATHILVSETLAMATMEMLPASHMLRLLIFPHIYKTIDINFKAANNLFPKNMLVHRASPYADGAFVSSDGSDGLLWKKAAVLKYTPFLQMYGQYMEIRAMVPEMPELPFFEDGKLIHTAVADHVKGTLEKTYGAATEDKKCDAAISADYDAKRFVLRFFDINDAGTLTFYPAVYRKAHSSCDAMHQLLTEMLFLVSGWHTHVGSVPDFFRDTRFAATAWKDGELMPRPKHSMMMMLLAATTAADMPTYLSDTSVLFNKWGGFSKKPDFGALRDAMLEVQAAVDERNAQRVSGDVMPFHQMEPQYVQWGVYV